jgi:hypothetical protein
LVFNLKFKTIKYKYVKVSVYAHLKLTTATFECFVGIIKKQKAVQSFFNERTAFVLISKAP